MPHLLSNGIKRPRPIIQVYQFNLFKTHCGAFYLDLFDVHYCYVDFNGDVEYEIKGT